MVKHTSLWCISATDHSLGDNWEGCSNRNRTIKPVIEVVELVCSHHIPICCTAALHAAHNGFDTIPDRQG